MERGAITNTQTQEQTPANTLNCENCLFSTYSGLPCYHVCVTCTHNTVIVTWLSYVHPILCMCMYLLFTQ